MLSRVIHDLYYLKRIHSVVLDEKLGQALKAKLTSLDLRTGPSPGPAALRRLLECLVYFQLEQSPVTTNAVSLVREELPNMNGSQLSRTIAACCTLGQHDLSVSAVPLLAEALPSMESSGTIQLIQSLASAGVKHEDTWSLLAEHCIRRLDSFTGQQLYQIIECFYTRKVHYPDFYVVAERHICAQPSSYISIEHLSGVIECYRGLGMPVMSLLAASSTRSAEGFDSGLAAVAPVRLRRDHKSEFFNINSLSSTNSTSNSTNIIEGGPSSNAVMITFVQSTLKAVKEADDPQLFDMLQKCEAKQVMHAEIMEAMSLRLKELHNESPDIPRTTTIIRLMMRFEKPEWFITASIPLSQLLDECGETAVSTFGHRMLRLADSSLKLFPKENQPTRLYKALVRDIKFDDIAASTDIKLLPLLVGVMISLKSYGGITLLEQHMSMINVAAANAPLRVQVELASMLASLPTAKKIFLPDLFNSLSSQKNWTRSLTARETILLLESLSRSRLPYNDLLLAVIEYTKKNLGRFDVKELVNILLQCAMLGFSDIEFYSFTATYILEKTSNSTVHDLCTLMFVFTFVLKGVIRVVQQILPRLRVSASHASSRDITLVLYSTVKLAINRHTEVTTPFCDRAVNIISSFKGEELASCLSSLRVLKFDHEGLLSSTAKVLGLELLRREGNCNITTNNSIIFTDIQLISIASAIIQLKPNLILQEWQIPLQKVCFKSLSSANASQTHLITITLAALDEAHCTLTQLKELKQHVEAICENFQTGLITAEVLLALHHILTRDGSTNNNNTNNHHHINNINIEEDEEARARELLAASPLLTAAQLRMSEIIASSELRDKLRRRGLLPVLAGVEGVHDTGDDKYKYKEIDRGVTLREAMLIHHKSTREATGPGRNKRNISRALKPTSGVQTVKKSHNNNNNNKRKKNTGGSSQPRRRASHKEGKEEIEEFDITSSTTNSSSSKRSSVKKPSIDFGVDSQGDIEEFRI